MQTVMCKQPLTTYNLSRERNCCTMHTAKATDVFSSHDCIFRVEQVPNDWHCLFSACGVNVLPPWPSPLRYSHTCLSPTYTRSVFEGGFEVLGPSARGTPTTHSEGLLLRVGALLCAPTYNRGVIQHVVFNRLGLAQPHECTSKAAMQTVLLCKRPPTASKKLYRGRNCCTTHTAKATYRYFRGTTASSSSSNPRMSAN